MFQNSSFCRSRCVAGMIPARMDSRRTCHYATTAGSVRQQMEARMNSQFFQQLQSWPMFRNARPPRSGFTLSAVVVGLLLLLPVVSQCQYQYTTNNSTITITGYTGSGGAVTIPSTINNLPVTSIGEYAISYAVFC